jgi:hypothetical protein
MKKILLSMVLCAAIACLTSCLGNNSSSSRIESSSTRIEDDAYWKSIEREQTLKDAGMEGAATIERNARIEYMQGGGYTSPDGTKQVHYQGSKEQKSDLEMIDAYFNEHGWD